MNCETYIEYAMNDDTQCRLYVKRIYVLIIIGFLLFILTPLAIKNTFIVVLCIVFCFISLTSGTILAYTHKKTENKILKTHFNFQIRTIGLYFLYLLLFALAIFGSIVLHGSSFNPATFILFALYFLFFLFWPIMRCLWGLQRALQNKPPPNLLL